MKKDKKWFADKWTKERDKTDVHDPMYHFINEFISDMKELDEPEVLSQKWIEKHTWNNHYIGEPFVYVKDLQNLLIPKKELPVIPRYVAEYVGLVKIDIPLMKILEVANKRNELPEWKKEYDWISANDEMFARAWLDGYTVADEQKYYVDLDTAAYVAKWNGDDQIDIYTDAISGKDEYEFHLTEQEIKNYDARFWPFAVKVEEVE